MSDKIITFRSTDKFHSHLIMESHRISLSRGETVSVSDMIREALESSYPTSIKSDRGDPNGKERDNICSDK